MRCSCLGSSSLCGFVNGGLAADYGEPLTSPRNLTCGLVGGAFAVKRPPTATLYAHECGPADACTWRHRRTVDRSVGRPRACYRARWCLAVRTSATSCERRGQSDGREGPLARRASVKGSYARSPQTRLDHVRRERRKPKGAPRPPSICVAPGGRKLDTCACFGLIAS